MDVTFRPATPDDIPDLARLHLMAAHGHTSVTVATHAGRIVGELHSVPYDEIEKTPPDPLVSKDRLALYEPFERLHPLASGSYYINIIAVYPEFRSKGIGFAVAGGSPLIENELMQFSGDLLLMSRSI
jgi:GNAT superfamily N-acetyltransferase